MSNNRVSGLFALPGGSQCLFLSTIVSNTDYESLIKPFFLGNRPNKFKGIWGIFDKTISSQFWHCESLVHDFHHSVLQQKPFQT